MSATEIQLYKTFRGTFGENGAQMVVEAITHTVKKEFDRNKELLATKQDVLSVKDDLRKEISGLRDELRKEIADTKWDLMKFMFAQTVVIIGLVVTLVKML